MSKHANHHKHQDEHHHKAKPKHMSRQKLYSLVAVGLMLVAMVVYVMTMDESEQPGGEIDPAVPADVSE
ncbi:hypothetical protein [Aeoliella sp.]|uniref:hypothetical protein n=1 Tax=Aeoliella sp. TaxID=2795800 RepID=UPI003CCBECE6